MANPYDILQYNIPRKWAETLVTCALIGTPLEVATKDWSPDEIDDFVKAIATGATVVKEDPESTAYKKPELTIDLIDMVKFNQGASDAWIMGCPDSNHPDYMMGWRATEEEAKQRDFAEEDRLINKYAP